MPGSPLGVAEAEDVTALRSRRSEPKRLEWSEASEENVGGIQKTSERMNSIFLFSRRKNKKCCKERVFSHFSTFKTIFIIFNHFSSLSKISKINQNS